MNRKVIRFTFIVIAMFFYVQADAKKPPQNVILMISDGCGYNHILCTDFYQNGKANSQVYADFPVLLAMSTYPLDGMEYDSERAWSDLEWGKKKYTDSAAAATAIATGFKTLNRYIGVDNYDKKHETILERAETMHKASGVVTSVQLSHATPAGFVAHHPNRNDYEIIAQQMLTAGAVDVIMGCGHPHYDHNGQKKSSQFNYKYVGGKTVWNDVLNEKSFSDSDHDGENDPWHIIQDRKAFRKLMSGNTPKRVLGIAQAGQTLNYGRDGAEKENPYEAPLLETVPTLAEMSKAALNVLDENKKGFFLMIEGGAIDWASHGNHLGRMIEEQIDFNHAVEAVVDWVEKKSSWAETLVIVTSDHETGYLNGPFKSGTRDEQPQEWGVIENAGKGNLPEVQWHSKNHTNHLVAFFARGAGSEMFIDAADKNDPVRGRYIDNTDIADSIFKLWQN